MTRYLSKPAARLASGGALAVLLGSTILTAAFTQSASADVEAEPIAVYSALENDGSVSTFFEEADGHLFEINISADGKTFTVYDGDLNDNPESDVVGPGSHSDKPDFVALVKLGAATLRVRIVPADSSKLMSHLTGSMGGDNTLVTHYNPGEGDDGSVPMPSTFGGGDKQWKKLLAEIRASNEVAREMGTIRQAMGDGSEGGSESPTGFTKGSNSGKFGDTGSYADGQDSTIGQDERDLLGPVPTIVNPPHEQSRGSERSGGSVGSAGHASNGSASHGAAAAH